MSYQNLIFDVKQKIAFITVNRPEVLNALNAETMLELGDAFAKVKNDSEIRAVIITGSGDRAFIAGADINELYQQTPISGKEFSTRGQRVFREIENLNKPVIAAINGFALGGGCELAMACHIRIASESAKLGQPEVSLGIIPGYGGTQRLSRLVGKGKAMEIILTGNMISAREAYEIGLVNRVVPSDKLMEESVSVAKTIISKGPIAIKLAIEAINRGVEVSQEEGLRMEATLFGLICTTRDMREGLKAFLGKREPNFKGV
ncbi:MAG: enoyl-CoA hydratase-related protein [Fidelibacterota bacterium]